MGYRSEGAIWLPKETYNKLSDELKDDLVDNWNNESQEVWSFSGFKWYESFEDVSKWTDFLRMCSQSDLDYDFIRLGEDDDDIEVATYRMFYLNRSWAMN
jgi:hypothetical protein